MADSLWPYGLWHTRFLCPSQSSWVCSNSYSLSHWCHPNISSSVTPLSSCLHFSKHRVFSNESALHIMWPKYWSFSISPSNDYSALIYFRIDWFDLLAVQGMLKSLLQHYSWKHQFFSVQPSLWSDSHIHSKLLGKSIALAGQTISAKWWVSAF